MVEILRTQTAALAAKQEEEKRLRNEEAKLLQEERELRELEENRSLQYKRETQREHKYLSLTQLVLILFFSVWRRF